MITFKIPETSEKEYKYYLRGFKTRYEYNKSYKYFWRQRLLLQSKCSTSTYWITLTFDESHLLRFIHRDLLSSVTDINDIILPAGYRLYDDDLTDIQKTDLTKKYYNRCFDLFIRRFKINLERHFPQWDSSSFKFFAVSENGDLFDRFHFHLLCYNLPYTTEVSKYLKGKSGVECNIVEEILLNSWSYGFVEFDDITFKADKQINYITKYMFKRFDDKLTFSRKSRNIGYGYFTGDRKKFLLDNLTTEFHVNGKTFYLGRFFRKKIFDAEQNDELLSRYYLKQSKIETESLIDFIESSQGIKIVNYMDNMFETSDGCIEKFSDYLMDYKSNCYYTLKRQEKAQYYDLLTNLHIKVTKKLLYLQRKYEFKYNL